MKILTRDYLLAVLQTRTQAQAAKYLGIGERTIRRIKNEPGHKTIARVDLVVKKKGTIARKKAMQYDEKSLTEKANKTLEKRRIESKLPKKPRGRWKFEMPDIPVIPPSERETRLDPKDAKLKTRMWSDVVTFDVRKLNQDQIEALIRWYRDRGIGKYSVNIIYKVPKGEKSLGGSTYNKAGQSATGWEDVSGNKRAGKKTVWTNDEITKQFNQIKNNRLKGSKRYGHNILFVQVQKTGK